MLLRSVFRTWPWDVEHLHRPAWGPPLQGMEFSCGSRNSGTDYLRTGAFDEKVSWGRLIIFSSLSSFSDYHTSKIYYHNAILLICDVYFTWFFRFNNTFAENTRSSSSQDTSRGTVMLPYPGSHVTSVMPCAWQPWLPWAHLGRLVEPRRALRSRPTSRKAGSGRLPIAYHNLQSVKRDSVTATSQATASILNGLRSLRDMTTTTSRGIKTPSWMFTIDLPGCTLVDEAFC